MLRLCKFWGSFRIVFIMLLSYAIAQCTDASWFTPVIVVYMCISIIVLAAAVLIAVYRGE